MTSPRERLVAIDVLRGLTIAGMLVVNDPGDPHQVFPTLAHSAWHGCTFADLVFPAFLFVLGITTHLSTRRHGAAGSAWPIWRRAGLLVLIGLALNAWPFFEKSALAGPDTWPTALRHIIARLASLRLAGVLQRIGVVYLITALLARRCSTRGLIVITVGLLVGYWALLTQWPVPGIGMPSTLNDPSATLTTWLDARLLDWRPWGLGWHLWDPNLAYDPEGVLSSVSAVSTALLGCLAGAWLTSGRTPSVRRRGVAWGGAILLALGLAWQPWYPINKPLWTGSYVLVTTGCSALALAAIMWGVDRGGRTNWTMPWLVFGTNPIVVYVGGELLATILRSSIKWRLDGHLVGTGQAVTLLLERLGWPGPVASLTWALMFTALCWLLVLPLYRRGKFISL